MSFSPLFIGALSSTPDFRGCRGRTPSFSPLFIGALSSTAGHFHDRRRRQGFSPLFIGALSSTSKGKRPASGKNQFQSPLHRGTLFNHRLLLLGASPMEFQSPLHRGTLFNSVALSEVTKKNPVSVPSSSGHSLQPSGSTCGITSLAVSVPSSSGNSLQQERCSPSEWNHARFSPLFIGELSSTLFPEFCVSGGKRFSPLFIGELSSTDETHSLRLCGILFQSPLHRGTLFNSGKPEETRMELSVSVPSSSGHSLRRHRSVPEFAASTVSVPSSSGHSLQPAPASSAFRA